MTMESGAVIVTRRAYERLIAVCRDAYPDEACGVLAADGDRLDGCAAVSDVLPVRNAAERPDITFAFDPHDWVRAYASMRRSRQTITGFYHAHPHAAPAPSAADAAGWRLFGGDALTYWIVSFAGGRDNPPAVAAFRMTRGRDGSLMLAQIRIEVA